MALRTAFNVNSGSGGEGMEPESNWTGYDKATMDVDGSTLTGSTVQHIHRSLTGGAIETIKRRTLLLTGLLLRL